MLHAFAGMCAKCGRAIMGESSGCKALDQLFHVACFTCVGCSKCFLKISLSVTLVNNFAVSKLKNFALLKGKAYIHVVHTSDVFM